MNIDDLQLPILLIVTDYGADAVVPIEARQFFENQMNAFQGTEAEFLEYISNQAPSWFQSVSEPPSWIQNQEWQYNEGRPMLYIGHIEVPKSAGLFHDDSRFFVFYDRSDGTTKTVIQYF
jgi:hypothetical protein